MRFIILKATKGNCTPICSFQAVLLGLRLQASQEVSKRPGKIRTHVASQGEWPIKPESRAVLSQISPFKKPVKSQSFLS